MRQLLTGAAAAVLAVLCASLGWALLDRLSNPLWPVGGTT